MEAENLLGSGPGPGSSRASGAIRAVAGKGMNEIRNMALLLRPSMLDDFGLVPALDWQAREIGKRTGLHVQVASEMADDLPEEHKTCIYRVVQEALNNCARHAQASTVQVSVRQRSRRRFCHRAGRRQRLRSERVRGLGLLGMEERVRHLGGAFHIDSSPAAERCCT